MRPGAVLTPSTSTGQLEDLKERKAIMIESNKVMVTMADFYGWVLVLSDVENLPGYGLKTHMCTRTHTHTPLITLKAKSGAREKFLGMYSSDYMH